MADRIVQLLDKDDNNIYPYAVALNEEPTEWFVVTLDPSNSDNTTGVATTITSKNGNTYEFYPVNGGTGWLIKDPNEKILSIRVRSWTVLAQSKEISFGFQGTVGSRVYIYTTKQCTDSFVNLQYDVRDGTADTDYPGMYYTRVNMTGVTAPAGRNVWYDCEITRRADTTRWFAHWNYRTNGGTGSGMGTIEITPTGNYVPTFYWQYFNKNAIAWYSWTAEIQENK